MPPPRLARGLARLERRRVPRIVERMRLPADGRDLHSVPASWPPRSSIVAVAALLGSNGENSAAQTVQRVGLMHVGTDHVPPSLNTLLEQLESKYGWDLPDADVKRCLDEKAKRCDLKGKNIELIWRNLEPEEADAQARVFVRTARGRHRRVRGQVDRRGPGGDREKEIRSPSSSSIRPIRSGTASSRACPSRREHDRRLRRARRRRQAARALRAARAAAASRAHARRPRPTRDGAAC